MVFSFLETTTEYHERNYDFAESRPDEVRSIVFTSGIKDLSESDYLYVQDFLSATVRNFDLDRNFDRTGPFGSYADNIYKHAEHEDDDEFRLSPKAWAEFKQIAARDQALIAANDPMSSTYARFKDK
jgi:hypothetical protein